MKVRLHVSLVVAAWALAAVSARGQVRPTQGGRRLDAGLRIGSGGYNARSRSLRLNSQLFVTGQVTGFSGFHGRVGYAAHNQLRVVLPSEVLDRFRGDSVGLGEATRGGTFRTEAYYRRTATALGVSGITDGRAAVGSNTPRTSRGEPAMVHRLYREATVDYAGLMDSRVDHRSLASPSALRRYRGVVAPMAPPGGMTIKPIAAPGLGVASPDLLRARGGADLARDLYELHRVDTSVAVAIDARVDASLGRSALRPGSARQSLPPLPGDLRDRGLTRGGKAVAGMPAPNQDVFMDLLVRLRQQRAGQGAAVLPPAGAVEGGSEPIVELSEKNDVVLHGFAGIGDDLFNMHMKRARKQLAAGEFYRAAGEYEMALAANRSNPLARMGLCVAHFCAGEPLTASMHLRRAFAMFPALMSTRVDIKRMMGVTVLRYRLAQLDKRVATEGITSERMLAFVLTFVHRNAGNTDEAKRYALMLKRVAKNDKILTGFATFVLTGKVPKKAPSPARAKPGARSSKP